MLENVKCYYRDNGKLACVNISHADSYAESIWLVRSRVLLEESLFEVKAPVLAVVQQ